MAVSSEPPGSFPNNYSTHKSDESDEEDEEPSEVNTLHFLSLKCAITFYYTLPLQDYPLRAAFGIGIIVVLLLLTVASVTLLALT